MNYEKVQATNVPMAPEQQISDKVVGLHYIASDIVSFSESIRAKLFGATPSNPQTSKAPESINDVLDMIRGNLNDAANTLSDINCRL